MNSNTKKAILMIGGSKSHFGGVAVSVRNYIKNIDTEEYDVDLLSPNSDAFRFVEKSFNGSVKAINLRQEKDTIFGKILYMCKLFRFLKKRDYYIVFVHSGQISFQWMNMFILKLAKIQNRISFSHSTGMYSGKIKKFVQYFLKIMISKWSTGKIGVSEEACKWLYTDKVIKKNEYSVFPNTIDVEKFKFNVTERSILRQKLGFEKDDFVIGSVGRLSPEKNHVFLLDLMESLRNHHSEAKLVIIGDGPLKKKLMDKIKSENLEDIIKILPSTSEINKYYNAFDLFLFPSKFEGFGITIFEAICNGLIVESSIYLPKILPADNHLDYLELDRDRWIKIIGLRLENYSFDLKERLYFSQLASNNFNKIGLNTKENQTSILELVKLR